jgi:hypothetical protein
MLARGILGCDTILVLYGHMIEMRLPAFVLGCLAVIPPGVLAQSLAPPSVAEKWSLFEDETFAPLTLGAGAFNATVSQATNSTPKYGRGFWPAYPERFGSAVGDITSQNFFGDFLLASAFHEDTRYIRRGPDHKLWARVGYAIGRSVITHSDTGETTFNASNVLEPR